MNSATAPSPDAGFGYSVVLSETFEDMLGPIRPGDSADLLTPTQFGEVVLRTACTVLQARGGAVKSHTARRVADWLAEQGLQTAWIPAVVLFDGRARGSLGADDLDRAIAATAQDFKSDGEVGLVVIDGLNEVDRERGDEILRAIGPFTAARPHLSVLVTDRLARRDAISPYWRYATLTPVPADTVREISGVETPPDALFIPFYLRHHLEGSGATQILAAALATCVRDADLPALASAAYASYETHRKRTIDRETVIELAGQPVWDRLVEAGSVVEVGRGDFHFNHHLLHDYLAGFHLALHTNLWNHTGFGVVTLSASSFDALALAVSLVADPTRVDDIVQRVFDWNFYAAAYMLEEDRNGSRLVSEASETAILGALAEKLFEVFRPTVVRVGDALRVQTTPVAAKLLAAAERTQVVDILMAHRPDDAPAWFDEWADYFSRPEQSVATSADMNAVTSAEPLVGWCVANALRRLNLADGGAPLRATLASDESPTVRWRAAHALGAHHSPENLELLRHVLATDTDEWVRYGALRAQFEQILLSRQEERRGLVADMVRDVSADLANPGALRTEAIRCLDVDPMPDHWHSDVEPMLEYLWETADSRSASVLAALAEDLRQRKGTHDVSRT